MSAQSSTCPGSTSPAGAEGRNLVGDPIDVVSGAQIDRARDFVIAEPAPIEWLRIYDSRWHLEDRGMGPGHRHAFDRWVFPDLDGLTYLDAYGAEVCFPSLAEPDEQASSRGYVLTRLRAEAGEAHRFRLSRHGEPTIELAAPLGERGARPVRIDLGADALRLRWDELGRLEKITSDSGRQLWLGYTSDRAEDSRLSQVTLRSDDGALEEVMIRYRYDARGRLSEGIDAYGQRFTLGYDEEDRITRRTDRRGYSFFYAYDREGRCARSWGEDGVLDTRLAYDPGGYQTTVTDANGGRWLYQHSPAGIVTHITDPLGGQRYYQVGEDGRLLAEYDEQGVATRYLFDEAGAPVAKLLPEGQRVSLPQQGGEQGEDPDPRAHRIGSTPAEWEQGALLEAELRLPDPYELPLELPERVREALLTSGDYRRGAPEAKRDLQGLLLREELEGGEARTYAYTESGGLRRVTDFEGHSWTLETASWNHIVGESDPLGHETRYEYTKTEQISAVIDAAGTRTEYAYDACDRLTEVRRSGGDGEVALRERYLLDKGGRLLEKRDAHGALLLHCERDAYGRLTRRLLMKGADQERHRFRYDKAGRIAHASTKRFRCDFAYDLFGRRTADTREEEDPVTGERRRLGVEHAFHADRLIESTVLGRFKVEYHHLDGGALILVDPTGRTHRIRRHGHGLVTRDLANGLSETVQYHPRGWVLSKSLYLTSAPPEERSRHAWIRRYRYSAEGDLLAARDSERGTTRHHHDAAHRLVRTERPDGVVEEYAYTASGSLIRAPGLSATPGEANRLIGTSEERFEHDERHHLSRRERSDGSRVEYTYDGRDQLVQVLTRLPPEPGKRRGKRHGKRRGVSADYDPLGRRVHKEVSGVGRTHYYWDTERLAAELFPDGSLRLYLYPDAESLVPLLLVDYADMEAEPSSGRIGYVFTDHLGAPLRVIDQAGEDLWRARLDPYGRAHVEVGEGFHQPLRWPGHYYDDEIGLCYNRFRYYDSELGRYIQADPLGLGGGLNVYAYTDNPLRQVDLRGLMCPKRGKRARSEPAQPGEREVVAEPGAVGATPAAPAERRDTRAVHSAYGDGTVVYDGEVPARLRGPAENASGSHSAVRWDKVNGRVYQSREYDSSGHPVRDVDFTSPTYPSGRVRDDHAPAPHVHAWEVNDPAVGPRSGHRRSKKGVPL